MSFLIEFQSTYSVTIAERVNTSENIRQLLGVSAKQYYTRQSYLMKTGLIERRHSVLTLTAFGQLVYSALLIIASACRQYSELLIIDVVKSTEGIPSKEQKDLINKLIIDPRIQKINTNFDLNTVLVNERVKNTR